MKRIITLLDERHAKVGYRFVHYGASEECEDCDLTSVCIDNLEVGRKYEVVGIREYEHECNIYDKVKVVEVMEPEVLGAVNGKKAFVGSSMSFSPMECNRVFCPGYKYCKPEGLKSGDRCKIIDAVGAVECDEGKDLQVVRLRRV